MVGRGVSGSFTLFCSLWDLGVEERSIKKGGNKRDHDQIGNNAVVKVFHQLSPVAVERTQIGAPVRIAAAIPPEIKATSTPRRVGVRAESPTPVWWHAEHDLKISARR